MASAVDIVPRGLARPYTHGSFQGLLDRFQDLIKEITLQGVDGTQEERRLMITENLRYDHFCESIREIFGGDIKNNDLKSIYRKISTNPDAKVDWSELFGYFQGDGDDVELALGDDISVFMVSARRRVGDAAGDRKRRDSIQSIKYISHLDAYITASQKGAISVWSTKLNLQSCTDINETAWVTGCDYVPGIRRVVVCTERSIAIWDSRAKGKNQQVYTVKPIESSPQCVACVPLLNANSHEDTLLFGDDEGYLNLMTLCAKDFTMKNQKGDKRFSQSYIIEPNKLTVPIKRRRLHDDWVLKIKYFPELRCFASCSPSSTSSFVLEEVERVLDDGPVRGVAIPKGVNAFDYCVRSNIIATGGVDKVIRVWHPHIFSRPTGKLVGHLFTIVDIVMNEKDQHIISLSTARVVRIWDINTLTSLQVFTDSEDRPGEKRIYSMMFDNKFDRLFTGSCVLDVWPLTRSVQDTMQVPHTHDRPISQLVYNAELKQLVSVCTESIMRVWEMSTGRQVYQIVEPNGQGIEVTALALDMSGFRMVTGALDGSLKVWDFGSGQELKYKPAIAGGDDRAVLGLRYCQIGDERVLIVAGWRNSLWMYQDSNDSSEFIPIHEFYDMRYLEREHITSSACSSLSKHSPLPAIGASPSLTSIFRKEYVLSTHEVTCMRSLLPDTLVTGCSNGDIILWDISKERSTVRKVLELEDDGTHSTDGTDSDARSNRSSKQECPRAVNSVYFLTHRVRKLDPAYMKRLAHLHSSEDGDSKVEDDTKSQLSTTNTVSGTLATTQEESSTAVESHTPEDGSKHQEEDHTDLEDNDKNNGGSLDVLDVLDEKQEDKQHSSDSPSANNPSKDSPVEDDNPENHMIVESFPPVMVTCHQDAYIRFWDLQGNLLREVSAKTRHQGAAVTALCHDQDCNIIVTADRRGYLTMWEIGEFLENPHSEERVGIKQVLCWRAHLTKITKIVYVDAHKVIVSGSTDGSLRLWWGKKSRFIGFFGQHRVFNYPTTEDSMGQIILPYDITEGPVAPVKSVSATQKMLSSQNKFDYPLIFDNNKWMPFRRSAYIIHRSIPDPEPQDTKFFGALIKPKPYLNKLESYTSGEMRHGAVFRALPVYRVPTPERLKTPDMGQNRLAEDTPVMFKAFAVQKGAKAFTKNLTDKGNKSTGKKSSRTLPSSTSPGAIVSPRRK